MSPQSALIVRNPCKDEFVKVEAELRRYLKERGVNVADKPEKADLLISLGGDGTLFYVQSKYGKYGLPIVGIGTIKSYICQATIDNWKQKLDELLGDFKLEERFLLTYSLDGVRGPDVLCDIVLRLSINNEHLRNPYRIIPFQVMLNNEPLAVRADGLIFATATGSTAYSASAGGPALPVDSSNFVLTGIAPYRAPERFRILSGSTVCGVEFWPEINLALIVDGQIAKDPLRDAGKAKPPTLAVFQSNQKARLVKLKSPSHLQGLKGRDQFFRYHFGEEKVPVVSERRRV